MHGPTFSETRQSLELACLVSIELETDINALVCCSTWEGKEKEIENLCQNWYSMKKKYK